MSIIHNENRIAHLTSSEIFNLVDGRKKSNNELSDKAMNYILEKNMEFRLNDSVETESNARPLLWGKLVEKVAFQKLDLSYTLMSDDTIEHSEYKYWSGSTDLQKYAYNGELLGIADIKCPYTKKSFCSLVAPLYDGLEGTDAMNALRNGFTDKNGIEVPKHKDAEKYYWQLVSNACIHNVDYVELIIYMPYRRELEIIKSWADGDSNYYFLTFAEETDLPLLKEDVFYKDINVIGFRVPQEDKDKLTELVKIAGKFILT